MLPALIENLLRPTAYPHPVTTVRLIETHISWVLLAGNFAYKVKKPLDLGFLDFSTLAKRQHCCAEEVRLNGRLAPEIYLAVVPITGSEAAPRVGGEGPALEWAVKMRAFDAEATLDKATVLDATQIDVIAERVAIFHAGARVIGAEEPYGDAAAVMHPVVENFAHLQPWANDQPARGDRLARLAQWSRAEGARLHPHFAARKAAGAIREGHGDLHLGNIAWIGRAPLIFDCIEFNPNLRCIDPVNEIAFLCMDLFQRGQAPLAWRLLNRWLEVSGDYSGLAALRFYLVYRAVVRAKVAAIAARQGQADADARTEAYLNLAERLSQAEVPALLLMHGLSGSGKTWASQSLLESLGAIRIRSDVERRRLAAHRPELPRYGDAMTVLTFAHLETLAAALLAAGFIVIVDATFLGQAQRRPFFTLADRLGVPLRLISLQAPAAVLRERVQHRFAAGHDASEADLAVLEAQLKSFAPLDATELVRTIALDSCASPDWPDDDAGWRKLLRLPAAGTD